MKSYIFKYNPNLYNKYVHWWVFCLKLYEKHINKESRFKKYIFSKKIFNVIFLKITYKNNDLSFEIKF